MDASSKNSEKHEQDDDGEGYTKKPGNDGHVDLLRNDDKKQQEPKFAGGLVLGRQPEFKAHPVWRTWVVATPGRSPTPTAQIFWCTANAAPTQRCTLLTTAPRADCAPSVQTLALPTDKGQGAGWRSIHGNVVQTTNTRTPACSGARSRFFLMKPVV